MSHTWNSDTGWTIHGDSGFYGHGDVELVSPVGRLTRVPKQVLIEFVAHLVLVERVSELESLHHAASVFGLGRGRA